MAGKHGLSMWTLRVQLLEDQSLGLRMSRWMGAGHLFVRPLTGVQLAAFTAAPCLCLHCCSTV